MAVKKCDECGGQVSDKAEKCPSCGAPVKKKTGVIKLAIYGIGGFFGLFVLLGVIAVASGSGDEKPDTAVAAALPTPTDTAPQAAPTPVPPPAPEAPAAPTKSAMELLDSVYQYDQENVDTHCKAEWEKRGELDQQMFNHCVGTEKSAHGDLIHLVKKHEALEWTSELLPKIWDQWTKRGLTQYSMVKHSMESEIDAFLDIEYESKQPSFNTSKMERCFDQWKRHASPWTMAKHCYEN